MADEEATEEEEVVEDESEDAERTKRLRLLISFARSTAPTLCVIGSAQLEYDTDVENARDLSLEAVFGAIRVEALAHVATVQALFRPVGKEAESGKAAVKGDTHPELEVAPVGDAPVDAPCPTAKDTFA